MTNDLLPYSQCQCQKLQKNLLVSLHISYADQLPFETIDKELDELTKELEELNMPVVLSHNDIWQENLMFDKDKGIKNYMYL